MLNFIRGFRVRNEQQQQKKQLHFGALSQIEAHQLSAALSIIFAIYDLQILTVFKGAHRKHTINHNVYAGIAILAILK